MCCMCAHAHCLVRGCVYLRSDHYDWAVSLFFSLNNPVHSKLHCARFHHCAWERAAAGLRVARRELGRGHLLPLCSHCQAHTFAGVLSKVENCEIRVILPQNNSVPLICFLHLVSLVLKRSSCSYCLALLT